MESLNVLTLTGNSVVPKIDNYRRTLIIKCVSFKYYVSITLFYFVVVVDTRLPRDTYNNIVNVFVFYKIN